MSFWEFADRHIGFLIFVVIVFAAMFPSITFSYNRRGKPPARDERDD